MRTLTAIHIHARKHMFHWTYFRAVLKELDSRDIAGVHRVELKNLADSIWHDKYHHHLEE
jgi:hypothetical protein